MKVYEALGLSLSNATKPTNSPHLTTLTVVKVATPQRVLDLHAQVVVKATKSIALVAKLSTCEMPRTRR